MTPPQQPEYIINEETVRYIGNKFNAGSSINMLRSRQVSNQQSGRDRVLDELERLYLLYDNDDKSRDDNSQQKYISRGSAESCKQAIYIVRKGGEHG